jgi:hypothetical protein
MPTVDLTAEELRDAAMAARLAAVQAQRDAAAQPNPRISAAFAAAADRYKTLGERFEQARTRTEIIDPVGADADTGTATRHGAGSNLNEASSRRREGDIHD